MKTVRLVHFSKPADPSGIQKTIYDEMVKCMTPYTVDIELISQSYRPSSDYVSGVIKVINEKGRTTT